MGTYIYGFRKASRNIIDKGEKTIVQHLSYSYKESFSMFPDSRYERITRLKDSQAERSFESYDGGYIIVGDVKDDETGKLPKLQGRRVYKNLKRSWWRDTGDHGMEYVGFLVKEGNSYHLVHAVTEREDDRAKLVAEFHPATKDDRESVQYHFTNKGTGKTESTYLKPDQMEYALNDYRMGYMLNPGANLASIIWDMVI